MVTLLGCFANKIKVWLWLAFIKGVPASVKGVESQSSPPKKTFTALSGAVQGIVWSDRNYKNTTAVKKLIKNHFFFTCYATFLPIVTLYKQIIYFVNH